jgi:chloramphenicol 3-O phosphotransferase
MGNIIFLNGCSSSGKTTLALKLQQLLPEPYQHIALDQFRDGLPSKVRGLNAPEHTPGASGLNVVPVEHNGEWVTQIQFGEHGERILQGMRRSIAIFSEIGANVIVDDLLFKREYLDDYVTVLDPNKVWFIGVKCALDVVNEREALRTGRFPGTATSHYHQVHSHGEAYDLEVDTSTTSPRQVAEQIIARLGSAPEAFARLKARGRTGT